jgi:hypothetical protein
MKKELWDLRQFCGPIQVVKALAPSLGSLAQPGDAQNLVHMAKEILGKFERVIIEAGRKL